MAGTFGEFDGVFWSGCSFFTWNELSRIKILRRTTQLNRLLQYHNWSFCTSLRLFAGFFLCFNMSEMACVAMFCRHVHILFQTCNSDTREDATTYMTDFYQNLNRHGISILSNEFSILLQSVCSHLRMGCKRRRSSFSSLTLSSVSRVLCVMTETTWVSFGTLSVYLHWKRSPTFLLT